MDGTVVASALVKTLCDKLGSPLLNEFSLLWGVETDLKAFESTISTVKDVLEDAEECFIADKQVYNWLRKLKENVYDADDFLNTLYLDALRREDASQGQTRRAINNFLAKSNPVKRLKLAYKIRSINKKLDAIAAERAKFHLTNKVVKYRDINSNYRETWSMIDEGAICGREHEKDDIIRQLMQNNGHENVSVISIVGLGGIGKTTLAQLVYNNEELNGYFNLKMWVYVPQKFDIRRIVREMIESAMQTKCDFENLDSLGEKLRSVLNGKKYLLVLDDVWSEKYKEYWEMLKSILNFGAFGSKIIVTTRFLRVSQIMNATSLFKLQGLSEATSWDLFKQNVFGGSKMRVDSRILEIAKEIMKKCVGVPLALKSIGHVMRFEDSIEKWLHVRNSHIWE